MIFVSLTVTCSNTGTIPLYHSTESEISVVLIGVGVAQSLVVYVVITACPSAEPEISVGFIGLSVPQSLVVYVAITAYPSRKYNKNDRDLRRSQRASSYSYLCN
jgi:hypothetical protein